MKTQGPTVWTTLALTLHADGSTGHELVGASPFPRHWIYDADGKLAGKSALIDFKTWYRTSTLARSPWGGHRNRRRARGGGGEPAGTAPVPSASCAAGAGPKPAR